MSLVPPHLTSRFVKRIVFVRPIPVLGSSQRLDQFAADDGWVIEVHDYGATISRPANPAQNIPETPAFCTCGVGYTVPAVEAPVAVEGVGGGTGVISEDMPDVALSAEAVERVAKGDPAAIAAVEAGQAVLPVVTVPAAEPPLAALGQQAHKPQDQPRNRRQR